MGDGASNVHRLPKGYPLNPSQYQLVLTIARTGHHGCLRHLRPMSRVRKAIPAISLSSSLSPTPLPNNCTHCYGRRRRLQVSSHETLTGTTRTLRGDRNAPSETSLPSKSFAELSCPGPPVTDPFLLSYRFQFAETCEQFCPNLRPHILLPTHTDGLGRHDHGRRMHQQTCCLYCNRSREYCHGSLYPYNSNPYGREATDADAAEARLDVHVHYWICVGLPNFPLYRYKCSLHTFRTVITSIVRLVTLFPLLTDPDASWAVATPAVWMYVPSLLFHQPLAQRVQTNLLPHNSVVEANLVIVCGCLPAVRQFLRSVAPRLIGESSSAQRYGTATLTNNAYGSHSHQGKNSISKPWKDHYGTLSLSNYGKSHEGRSRLPDSPDVVEMNRGGQGGIMRTTETTIVREDGDGDRDIEKDTIFGAYGAKNMWGRTMLRGPSTSDDDGSEKEIIGRGPVGLAK